MKKFPLLNMVALSAGAALVGCLSAGTAVADGMPRGAPAYAPAPSFAGFYVGGHLGIARGSPEATLFDDGVGSGEVITSPSFRSRLAGVQGGYNFQNGPVLVGVEVDWSWASGSGTTSVQDGGDPSPDIVTARLRHLGSVRGRAGFVWDRVLLFGTAGWGWTRASYTLVDSDEGTLRARLSDSGLVWGGGVEFLVTPSLTLGVQYLHYDFGKDQFLAAPAAFRGASDASLRIDDINEWRVSLNFKFGGDRREVPLK